jgi:hypothetical protein
MRKELKLQDLVRPIVIDVGMDGTCTFRRKGVPAFDRMALPVFTVNTEEEAQDLIVLLCSTYPNGTKRLKAFPRDESGLDYATVLFREAYKPE